ncbi:MAG TPA: DNA ligase D [Desulfuromonadaceae bacterium]|jgi:bifunctional non-homologous end joining protein LigD
MGLEEYKKKRDLDKSHEPAGKPAQTRKKLSFVIQKHAASHLHYDFRLELDGVLKSWAIPKGPTLDPSIKRLAMQVEDHPYDYKDFEGIIPKGNYGAGEVIIWDEGHYSSLEPGKKDEESIRKGFYKGDLKFILHGHKLKGEFALVRIRRDDDKSWLLIKKHDEFASTRDITLNEESVRTRHKIEAKSNRRTPEKGRAGSADQLAKAIHAPMPHAITPMLASSIKEPFDGADWIFEIKLDGYRTIAEIENGNVLLYSRNNLSFNNTFAALISPLETIDHAAVLDGEVVALDDKGKADFQLLQNYRRTGRGNIFYFIFDLIYLDGKDLRNLPLIMRKELLADILPVAQQIRYCDHIAQEGIKFFQLARKNDLEGIVAKKASSSYQTGKRSKDWLKIKIKLQQEAIICGFTEPRGGRKYFGALVLGVYEKKELTYIGLSGGGFDENSLKEIHAMLLPLIQAEPSFKERVKTDMPVKWVKPVMVCEVSFTEWTGDRVMRHPIFLGLRDDKAPESAVREIFSTDVGDDTPPGDVTDREEKEADLGGLKTGKQEKIVTVEGHRIKMTNLDKIFWPEEGYSKGDVIDYYRKYARYILPYLKDRPESLYRTPGGLVDEGFYQKEAGQLPPKWVQTEEIFSKHNDKNIRYFLCQDEATLVYMANLGCIEINPWLSRIQNLDKPDYLVIDLDPEEIAFEKVVEAALVVNEVLKKAGAKGFPKTSGATGIHIYVPLNARYEFDTAVRFAQLVAVIANNEVPDFTSITRFPGKRQKKVYLDFLQNRAGQTLAAPYSIRVQPGATVSTPLKWAEVKPGLDPTDFTIRTIGDRLAKTGDLFEGVLGPGIDISKCIKRLDKES